MNYLHYTEYRGDMMFAKELLEKGKHEVNDNLTIVRKELSAGDTIDRHNHEGYNVSFTLCQGKADIWINAEEKHTLTAPAVLNFDGKNTIEASVLEDAVAYIYLTK